ncbi:uracil-DNA glycosylase [Crateriforma conspicua]|uniref:uracil-DNA glycosylase n=1 Tax=Crateriforma conspicua TaxID=2527996 RepID=UPI00118B5EC5|nr:uracil-DNA glycosylase [Crateriforma conspicua]QDV64801.1 Uracil DNA glycosylase superfamily protein [Crateriforma conspicua]
MQNDELLYAASQLARHLRRSGVQWMPGPDAEKVAQLADSFQPPDAHPPSATRSASPSKPAPPPAEGPRKSAASRAAGRGESGRRPAASPPDRLGDATRSRLAGVPPMEVSDGPYPGKSLSAPQRLEVMEGLAATVSQCQRCRHLASCRKQTVFGEGSVTPRFAFFGEGPGADEDRTGRPFVGRAGQLLTKMIEACTLRRDDVYILNTVKCRPPGNRNPEPTEIENCREYFTTQLSTLRPEYVVCLGAIAAQTLLQSKLSVGRLRGKLHRYFDSKVLVTYHPAYLLRNPSAKRAAWEDLQLMLRDAGIRAGQ